MRVVHESGPEKGAKISIDVVFAISNRCLLMTVFVFSLLLSFLGCFQCDVSGIYQKKVNVHNNFLDFVAK